MTKYFKMNAGEQYRELASHEWGMSPPDGFSVIYQYTDENRRGLGEYKIGQSRRAATERIAEQQNAACSCPLECVKVWGVVNGFTDHVLHKLLKRNGYSKFKEWFNLCTSIDAAAIDVVATEINGHFSGIRRSLTWKPRAEQQGAINVATEYFENGGDRFLLDCCPRFGKITTSLNIVNYFDIQTVLIITFKPDVRNEWANMINNHVDFATAKFVSVADFDKKNPVTKKDLQNDKGGPVFCFVSIQDLLGKDVDGNFDAQFKNKLQHLAKVNWDFVIFDEVHIGGQASKTRSCLDSLAYDRRLDLSGTPIKLCASGEYEQNQIYRYSYLDDQKGPKRLPSLRTYGIDICNNRAEELKEFFLTEEGLLFKKFFAVVDGNFVNSVQIDSWLDLLEDSNVRKYASPFFIENLGRVRLGHQMWLLDNVASCEQLAIKLRSRNFYKKYDIIVAAGNNEGEGNDTPELVRSAIASTMRADKKVIILTCGKLCTGVTIPELNSMFLLTDRESPEALEQAIARILSAAENKNEAYLIDFAPVRTLTLRLDMAKAYTKPGEDTRKVFEELWDHAPIMLIEGNNYKETTPAWINAFTRGTKITADNLLRRMTKAVNVDAKHLSFIELIKEFGITGNRPAAKLVTEISKSAVGRGNLFKSLSTNKSSKLSEQDALEMIRESAEIVSASFVRLSFILNNGVNASTVKQTIANSDDEIFQRIVGITIDNFKKIYLDSKIIIEESLNDLLITLAGMDKEQQYKFVASPSNEEMHTPISLVREAYDRLEDNDPNIFQDYKTTVCDPACKEGIWLLEAADRLMNSRGMKKKFPNEKDRQNHIWNNQLYGSACTLGSAEMARRIIYNDRNRKGNIVPMDANNISKLPSNWPKTFSVVVGNPPYNGERNEANNQSTDIYDNFTDLAHELADKYVLFVTPSRWFIKNSAGIKDFRYRMINEYGLKALNEIDSVKTFGINIKGGCSYFLLEKGYVGKTLVNDEKMVDLQALEFINLTLTKDEISYIKKTADRPKMSASLCGQSTFGIKTNDKRFAPDGIRCKFSERKGGWQTVQSSAVKREDLVDTWKAVCPAAVGEGGEDLSANWRVLKPGEIYNESYVGFCFDTKVKAEACIAHLKTPIVCRLISVKKIKQHVTAEVFSLVPMP